VSCDVGSGSTLGAAKTVGSAGVSGRFGSGSTLGAAKTVRSAGVSGPRGSTRGVAMTVLSAGVSAFGWTGVGLGSRGVGVFPQYITHVGMLPQDGELVTMRR
jgi:hypothetical protein